jgi:hypothetical protein
MEKNLVETILSPKFWRVEFSEPVVQVLGEEKEGPFRFKPLKTRAHIRPLKKKKISVGFETGPDKFIVSIGNTSVDLMPQGSIDQFMVNGKTVSTKELSEMIGPFDYEKTRDDPTSLSEIQQVFYAIGAYGVIQLPFDRSAMLGIRASIWCKIACISGAVVLGVLVGAAAMAGCTAICAAGTVVTIGTLAIPCGAIVGLCTTAGFTLGYEICYAFLIRYC